MKPITLDKERKERTFVVKYWWAGMIIILAGLIFRGGAVIYAPFLVGAEELFYMAGAAWLFGCVGYIVRMVTELRVRKTGQNVDLQELDLQIGDKKQP